LAQAQTRHSPMLKSTEPAPMALHGLDMMHRLSMDAHVATGITRGTIRSRCTGTSHPDVKTCEAKKPLPAACDILDILEWLAPPASKPPAAQPLKADHFTTVAGQLATSAVIQDIPSDALSLKPHCEPIKYQEPSPLGVLSQILPTEHQIEAAIGAQTFFDVIQSFFAQEDRMELTEVREHALELSAVALVGYNAIDLVVTVCSCDALSSKAIIQHPSRKDTVGFSSVVNRIASSIKVSGSCTVEQASPIQHNPCLEGLLDDSFDDFEEEDMDPAGSLTEILCLVESKKRSLQVEGLIALATRTRASQRFGHLLADALVERPQILEGFLRAGEVSLDVLYPAAEMLATVSQCEDLEDSTREALQGVVGAFCLTNTSSIIQAELLHALRNLRGN